MANKKITLRKGYALKSKEGPDVIAKLPAIWVKNFAESKQQVPETPQGNINRHKSSNDVMKTGNQMNCNTKTFMCLFRSCWIQ